MSEDVDLRRPEIIGIDNSFKSLPETFHQKGQNSGAGSELVKDTRPRLCFLWREGCVFLI